MGTHVYVLHYVVIFSNWLWNALAILLQSVLFTLGCLLVEYESTRQTDEEHGICNSMHMIHIMCIEFLSYILG